MVFRHVILERALRRRHWVSSSRSLVIAVHGTLLSFLCSLPLCRSFSIGHRKSVSKLEPPAVR